MSRTMSKSQLKARMLEVFRGIQESGEPLYVSDYGRPVLKIEPIEETRSILDVFARFQGEQTIPDEALEAEAEDWGEYL